MSYVFDASAIVRAVELLGSDSVDVLRGQYTIDLAYYEIGNFIWKAFRKGLISDTERFIELFTGVLAEMRVVRVGLRKEVARLAASLGLTYYDAAYLWLAHRLRLTLVSEDSELCRAYDRCIPVNQLTH